ncbi:MAG: DNA damage-inducible protein D [Fibrobacterota bacterium]|nr:DNA damage-inducible protein D [Fibrobacterota bacterium]
MNELALTSQFEAIKHASEKGTEFWTARELQPRLGYASWQNFAGVIRKAIEACKSSEMNPLDHFNGSIKMVPLGSGAQRKVEDFILSRHGCFLIAMNGESTVPEIAAAQTYFAIQTHKQEKFEKELEQLDDDQKRVMLRNELSEHNKNLASAAKTAGVVNPFDYAVFQDEGYKGLYGGLGNKDIHNKKGLKKSEKILDHMGSTELAANLFRATQTEDKLKREKIATKTEANRTHREVGRKVRKTIAEIGGTMPEDLPAETSIKKVESHLKKKIGKPGTENPGVEAE